ncbi:MAG: alpha/beta fold hydrolase [Chthoniobacterales bacterium]|jgi:alpha-beta hydrolase superfamily lysophospholipase
MAVLTIDDLAGGANPFTWCGADGTPFPGLAWEPAAERPAANVLCIHGLSGAAADFGPLARHLAAAGAAVRALNLRGQGNDPDVQRRGHFLDPAAWREDLAVFADGFEHQAPLFVVGESMGALVAVDAVAHGALQPERIVLAAPVTQTRAAVPGWVIALLRAAAGVCPRAKLSPLRFVHGKTALPRLTADDDYMAYLQTIPHRVGGFTIDFLTKFEDLMRAARENARRITAPTLLLAGGHDIFIRPDQSRSFFDSLGAEEKEFCLYPESHHLLWHDVDRDDVLERIRRWILEGRG